MHEFSLAQGLMRQLADLAAEHGATKIIRVSITIGRLSGIVVDSFIFGFETLAGENELTRDAVLEITETQPARRCLDCNHISDAPISSCSQCHSARLIAAGGDELLLTQVEME